MKIPGIIPTNFLRGEYLRMHERTVLKRIERFGAIIVFLLMIIRMWLGTEINGILLSALVIFSIGYMWSGFFLFSRVSLRDLATPKSRSQVSPFMVVSSIVMGFIYSFCTLAVIYGIFFYSGMNFMLSLAFFFILASTSITIAYHWLNKADRPLLRQYYKRSAVMGILCLALWVIPVDTKLQFLFREHPEFIEAYKAYRENPDNPVVHERLRSARSYFR
ncbi:MAG TPA: hypothetical protein VLH61_02185 [Bacteroidales bacterium]|nr:hypothetical protein [Bacteroidales bacterium]